MSAGEDLVAKTKTTSFISISWIIVSRLYADKEKVCMILKECDFDFFFPVLFLCSCFSSFVYCLHGALKTLLRKRIPFFFACLLGVSFTKIHFAAI
jgi:hypothetical protein